ncbi:MAG: hypothetical protein WCO65_01965 [bacterium]
MKFRGAEYGNVFFAPGTFGYFGEKKSLFSKHTVFVSKTVTVAPFESDMHKKGSIKKFGAGIVIEVEDLSNPGITYILDSGKLQKQKNPFFISLTFVGKSFDKKIQEAHEFVEIFTKRKKEFQTNLGLYLCFSNQENDEYESLKKEIIEIIQIMSVLEIPLVVEISVSFPPDMTRDILCDAIALRGTVLLRDMPLEAQKVFFNSEIPPLVSSGEIIVSGKYVAPLAYEWARQAKKFMEGKVLLVGGGIQNIRSIDALAELGVRGIILDKATFLRIWNIRKIIRHAQNLWVKNKK